VCWFGLTAHQFGFELPTLAELGQHPARNYLRGSNRAQFDDSREFRWQNRSVVDRETDKIREAPTD